MNASERPRPPTTPTDPPPPPPSDHDGPYSTDYGRCLYGHPVNWAGRCEPLNRTPPACPTRLERTTYLATLTVDQVVAIAQGLGIAIPPLLSGNVLRATLIPLIATAEGLLT